MPNCHCCGQTIPIGQSRLNRDELKRLPLGNQHTKWNVIKWQVVKAAAKYYDVQDWTAKVDTSLTYEENINLMARYGTNIDAAGGPTLKELAAEEKAITR